MERMSANNYSVLIFAPFYNNPKHVGSFRVGRIIKWLRKNSFNVNVVSRGSTNAIHNMEWGTNYVIKSDLLDISDKLVMAGRKNPFVKVLAKIAKLIFAVFCIPDEELLWARKAIKNKKVVELAKGTSFFFSSSPMESAHIAPYKLSVKMKKPFVVDMRDGWLDDSLKPDYLLKLPIRNKLEQRLEKTVLFSSRLIFVTNMNWKKSLVGRYPDLENKVAVLTNAYPDINFEFAPNGKNTDTHKVTLCYAGRFGGSDKKRKFLYLFKPFNNIASGEFSDILIKIYTDLSRQDKEELNYIEEKRSSGTYSYEIFDFIPRMELMKELHKAGGLILLSASQNAVPAKLFEYMVTKKPVLAITFKGTAVWEMCLELPQFFLYDIEGDEGENKKTAEMFLDACMTGKYEYALPEKYTEDYLEKIFKDNLNNAIANS